MKKILILFFVTFSLIANAQSKKRKKVLETKPITEIVTDTISKEANNAFTAEEQATFEKYLEGQMAKIELPQKDEAFLRQRMLEMYANPLINQRSAL